jgi:hypothetical protein
MDCFNANPRRYSLTLSCATSANYTCYDTALTVASRVGVTLSPASGCQRPFRLLAGRTNGSSLTGPFIIVTGPRAKLYLNNIRLMLGLARPGIEASGGRGTLVSLERSHVTSGRGGRGANILATNAQVILKKSRVQYGRAREAGGGLYVTAPAGGLLMRFKALQMSDSLVSSNRVRERCVEGRRRVEGRQCLALGFGGGSSGRKGGGAVPKGGLGRVPLPVTGLRAWQEAAGNRVSRIVKCKCSHGRLRASHPSQPRAIPGPHACLLHRLPMAAASRLSRPARSSAIRTSAVTARPVARARASTPARRCRGRP